MNIKKTLLKNKQQTPSPSLINEITFTDVDFVYNRKSPYEFQALKNINFQAHGHKVIGVIGSTGSGKSTLIQHINGLIVPTKGQVVTHGYRIKARTRRIRKVKGLRSKVGLVFQFPEYQLFQETIRKDIMFGPLQIGATKREAAIAADKYLQTVGLPLTYMERSPFNLSGGQKRRVAVAGILAMGGATLVLDEPTAGLDPAGVRDFVNLFLQLNRDDNKQIILVTHNMDQVLEMCDETIVMKKGEIIERGTAAEIFSNEALIADLRIEPPKIYKLLFALKKEGIDLTGYNIKSIPDFAKVLKQYLQEGK